MYLREDGSENGTSHATMKGLNEALEKHHVSTQNYVYRRWLDYFR